MFTANFKVHIIVHTAHWSNSGLLAKKLITHKISPDIIHLDLNKDPYVFNQIISVQPKFSDFLLLAYTDIFSIIRYISIY